MRLPNVDLKKSIKNKKRWFTEYLLYSRLPRIKLSFNYCKCSYDAGVDMAEIESYSDPNRWRTIQQSNTVALKME